ncbi:MAG: hypothetical protein K0S67_1617 [Nitrososphaeraceae archaeon]|jgi:hypothetical protein|nr:hypothetical protein [Nitrososphaeraceae archaeon]MCD6037729.1 hypothetical protein [Nitrososphaeraceae archaeon]MDF2768505.1 hypothetical protein [Nitrososphaeraceae archaeon]
MISREIPPMHIVVNVKAAKLAKVITVNIKSLDNADYYDIPLTI